MPFGGPDSERALILLRKRNARVASQLLAEARFAVTVCAQIARYMAGKLDQKRRLSVQTTYLLWVYTVGQGIFGLLLTHGFPRLVGS